MTPTGHGELRNIIKDFFFKFIKLNATKCSYDYVIIVIKKYIVVHCSIANYVFANIFQKGPSFKYALWETYEMLVHWKSYIYADYIWGSFYTWYLLYTVQERYRMLVY